MVQGLTVGSLLTADIYVAIFQMKVMSNWRASMNKCSYSTEYLDLPKPIVVPVVSIHGQLICFPQGNQRHSY